MSNEKEKVQMCLLMNQKVRLEKDFTFLQARDLRRCCRYSGVYMRKWMTIKITAFLQPKNGL